MNRFIEKKYRAIIFNASVYMQHFNVEIDPAIFTQDCNYFDRETV